MMALCSRSVKEARKVESESTMEGPNWLELPRDITEKILHMTHAWCHRNCDDMPFTKVAVMWKTLISSILALVLYSNT
ncbi:F-box/LRR protein [Sesbania bispinosa]|nr:F-box/LRR protein [Sesbania bispinosa]